VALHSDESLLPADKKAWAAWNYMAGVNEQGQDAISVSYLINELQPLPIKGSVVVSLHPHQKIDPNKIILERAYYHPLFNSDAIMAQEQIESIQGADRGIFYCGAWQRYGFHEDGILSAKKAINHILKLEGLQEIEVR
jgi:predicted NAD/FAD-binding protein